MDSVFVRVGRYAFVAIAAASLLAACDNHDASQAAAQLPPTASSSMGDPATPPAGTTTPPDSTTNPVHPENHIPTLGGSQPGTVEVGASYSFQPVASDADHDALKFTIAGKPSWAKFDTATGRLYGTPAQSDVGVHEDIVIGVSDGHAEVQMPSFAITVTPAASATHNVALSWIPPKENTDGSPLVNLTGYRIHYGTVSKNYSTSIDVPNAGITRYVVEDLPSGEYYFSITAIAGGSIESEFSTEASVQVL